MTPTLFRRAACAAILLTITFVTTGCGRGGPPVDPILALSTQEALERGNQLMEEGKYNRAHKFLTHAFESAPNSREGRGALLRAADALYQAGGVDNYVLCEAKYRDFINRFPTSEQADYAQFQIANCLSQRMEKPDRDQDEAYKALESYEELFRLYPTSDHVDEARTKADSVRNQLAQSEILVGSFYVRYRLCRAAINRLEPVAEDYPTFSDREELLFFLCRAYLQCRQTDQAADVLAEMTRDYPNSKHLQKLQKMLEASRKKSEQEG